MVHSPLLPSGSAVVTRHDIVDNADLSTVTYQVRHPDGTMSSEGSTASTLSIRGLLALPALHWTGGDPVGQITYTEAPHRNSVTPSYLDHDALLAPGTPGYPFGDGPPPAVWVDGASIQYVRPSTGPTDVNLYDFWQTAEDGELDLTVHTTGVPPLQPTLSADHTRVRSHGTVRFTVTLAARPGGEVGYRWTFGDGRTVPTADPTTTVRHVYPAQGGSFVASVEALEDGEVAGRSDPVTITVGTPAPPTHGPSPHPGAGSTHPPTHALPTGPRHSRGHTGGASPSPTPAAGSLTSPGPSATPGAPATAQHPSSAPSATAGPSASASPTTSSSPSAAPTRDAQPGPSAAALPVIQGELIASDTTGSAATGAAASRAASAPPSQRRVVASRSAPWAVLAVALLLAVGAVGEAGLARRPIQRLGRFPSRFPSRLRYRARRRRP